MNRRKRSLPLAIVVNAAVLSFSLSCIFPILWIAYTSFKSLREYSASVFALPAGLYLNNYAVILKNARFGMYFYNSLIVGLSTLALVLVFSFLSAYFLSRWRFRGRNAIYAFFMLGMVVPTHAWLLPVFIQFKKLYLLDKSITLVIPYVAFALPMAVFLIESFVRGVPKEMEESAVMDGCSIWRTLVSIIFPLCRPVIATVVILTFNNSWNEFPFALVLINKNVFKTVPVALTMFMGDYTTNYPQLIAALCIAVVPVVAVYLAFSKRIIQGMTAGAVKG
jgi:raffinose/stachyose/melibiose transport system permease protein